MTNEELSIKLLRHQLGSIDISDIDEGKEISKEERKQYCAAIFAVWPRLEKDIKTIIAQQIYLIAESENWEKVNYGRGICNGISLLYELWKRAATEFEATPGEETETFDETKVMPEI